jgi:hypothetical protein
MSSLLDSELFAWYLGRIRAIEDMPQYKEFMKAESVQSDISFENSHEVIDIRYSFGRLSITVSAPHAETCVITFEEVVGFRVMDEGNLLEFWPECSSQRGWLFRVIEGGWFSQESQRNGFLAGDVKAISEYLVTGANDCVNILSGLEPKMSRLPR